MALNCTETQSGIKLYLSKQNRHTSENLAIYERGDKVTADDYTDWANEYFQEVEAVEHRIIKTKKKLRNSLGNMERQNLEEKLSMFYSQKIEYLSIAKELEEKARAIREKEGL